MKCLLKQLTLIAKMKISELKSIENEIKKKIIRRSRGEGRGRETYDRNRHAQKERRGIVTILRKNDNGARRPINHVTINLLS